MFTSAPYFLKWPTFCKLSGPFVPMDLISGQNPGHVFGRVENIVEKRRKLWFPAFSPSSNSDHFGRAVGANLSPVVLIYRQWRLKI